MFGGKTGHGCEPGFSPTCFLAKANVIRIFFLPRPKGRGN